MRYIIDGIIGFRADDGSLLRIDSNDSVILPVAAQRLMLILLESHGEVLERDELLVKVWDNYGLTGSGNSLNQYLSLIRRNMSAFGCDTFIETLPKVGIRLHEGVRIVKEECAPVVPDAQQLPELHPVVLTGGEGRSRWRAFLPAAAAFLASVSVAALLTDDGGADPHPVVHVLPGGCGLVTFFEPAEGDFSRTVDEASAVLKSSGRECGQGYTLYFDNISAQSDALHARTLMAVCEHDARGSDSLCHNFYYDGVPASAVGAAHDK